MEGTQKDKTGTVNSNFNTSILANSKLVSCSSSNDNIIPDIVNQQTFTASGIHRKTPVISETEVDGTAFIRRYISKQRISDAAKHIITSSWRNSTKNRYETTFRKWENFCSERAVDTISPSISDVINFLTGIFEDGNGYSSVFSARSVSNNVITVPGFPDISEHPLLKRFIKGIFNLVPPKPRYSYTWDVKLILDHIEQMGENNSLSFKKLSQKIVTLLMILSGERINSISSFTIHQVHITEFDCTFIPSKLLKHSRPSFVYKPVRYRAYPHNLLLCPVTTISEYVKRRESMNVQCDEFIITHGKPHKPAHSETMSRWLKEVL